MEKWICVIAAAFLLTACADTHQLIRTQATQNVHLTSGDSIFIAAPEDGSYGADTYRGSGQNTARIIYSAFARHTSAAKLGRTPQSIDEAQTEAVKNGKKFLIYPTILHWEDRATEWSGKPDRVEIQVDIVDPTSGTILSSVILKGKSGLATFGGDHPQDLLPKPVEEFVSSLY